MKLKTILIGVGLVVLVGVALQQGLSRYYAYRNASVPDKDSARFMQYLGCLQVNPNATIPMAFACYKESLK